MDETTLLIVCAGISTATGIIAGAITATIISKKRAYKKIGKLIKAAGKAKSYAEVAQIIAAQVEENKEKHEELEKDIGILNWERGKNIKKVGYIRYNSTEDIGGRLSFSLIMLNEENSGIILTNIHMRESSSIYLREVKLGECEINLSEEEIEGLKNTKNK